MPIQQTKEEMEALSLAVRTGTRAEVAVYLAARSRLKVDELEKVHFLAFQNGPKAERLKKLFCRAVDGRLTADEFLSLAPPSGVPAKEQANFVALAIRVGLYSCVEKATFAAIRSGRWDDVKEILPVAPAQTGGTMSDNLSFPSLAVRAAICNGMEVEQILSFATNYVNNNADLACHVLVQNRIPADAVLEAAMKTGLMAREKVYASLLEQLLASFAKPLEDTQLREWERPPKPQYSVTEKRSGPRQDPKCPFFLINVKASAETAQISWSMKKYPRFPRERAMHNALRVARLGTGTQGFHVEQAGEGGQPGAFSYFIDATYTWWPRPKEGIFEEGSSVPLREVAVIKRLPGGDGISVMSYVHGLGVKLDDILFVLHVPSAAMPLRFTEQSLHVSENFEEIPLYAATGLDFIDINAPVKNSIKKLYQLYLQEEQEKNIKREKQGHRGSEELVCQQEELMLQRHETEEEKLERLRRRREDSKKHRDLRKEMKEVVHRIKDTARTSEEEEQHEEEYDPMLLPFLFQEECGLVKPLEKLCQSEKRHDGSLVKVMEQFDLLDLGGGGSEARGMREPSPALVY